MRRLNNTIFFTDARVVVALVVLSCCCNIAVAINLKSPPGVVYAGVAKINGKKRVLNRRRRLRNRNITNERNGTPEKGTLPLGTPLAGYNHGARAYKYWPLINPKEYTTWMEPR